MFESSKKAVHCILSYEKILIADKIGSNILDQLTALLNHTGMHVFQSGYFLFFSGLERQALRTDNKLSAITLYLIYYKLLNITVIEWWWGYHKRDPSLVRVCSICLSSFCGSRGDNYSEMHASHSLVRWYCKLTWCIFYLCLHWKLFTLTKYSEWLSCRFKHASSLFELATSLCVLYIYFHIILL